MYIGVEYMKQKILDLAYEHLKQSYSKCSTDPFLLNELGVYFYYTEEWVCQRCERACAADRGELINA